MQEIQTLVTGAAGFVGGRLILELLGRGVRVDALARPRGALSAADRLAELADDFQFPGPWPPPGLRVIEADLDELDLGLGRRAARRLLAGADQVFHAAALVSFAERERDALMRSNVETLRRLAPLLEDSGTVFNHVSTAYVCGFVDDLGRPTGRFRNPYEESKARAEAVVRGEIARRGVAWRILRPSIILGDYRTGRTRNFNTLYTLLQILDGLHAAGGALRIECDPSSALDVVPIDWVVRAALALAGDPATRHRVFHLSQPAPVDNAALGGLLSAIFAPLEIIPGSGASFAVRPMDERERLVARGLRTYRAYLDRHPRFDATATRTALAAGSAGRNLECPPVTGAWLGRLVDWARQADWGRRPKSAGAARVDPAIGIAADCRRFFDRELAARVGRPLLAGTRRIDADFEVRLTDLAGFRRTVEVRDGTLLRVSGAAGAGPAQCSYELTSADFLHIAAGELDPREAFFARRTEIRGDIEAGLRVATLMIDFFRRHPFRPRSLTRRPPAGAAAQPTAAKPTAVQPTAAPSSTAEAA